MLDLGLRRHPRYLEWLLSQAIYWTAVAHHGSEYESDGTEGQYRLRPS